MPDALLPPFSISIHVTSINGVTPTGADSFTFQLYDYPFASTIIGPVTVTGTNSATLTINQSAITAMYNSFQGWINPRPIQVSASIIKLTSASITDFTSVAGTFTVTATGATRAFTGELYLRDNMMRLGVICWNHGPGDAMLAAADTPGGTPDVRTYAQYAQRFLNNAGTVPTRPELIYDGDYWLAGDSDRLHTLVGHNTLARLGCNAVTFQPGNEPSSTLLNSGLFPRYTAGTYTVPGGTFPWRPIDPNVPGFPPTPEGISAWAADWAARIVANNLDPLDLAHFAMADEPGWYPETEINGLLSSTAGYVRDAQARLDALTDFRNYVLSQGYVPIDLGFADIPSILPDGVRRITGTREQILLYVTTVRWLANAASRHFADCLAAMLSHFPNTLFAANKNNFASRPVSEAPFWVVPFGSFSWLEEGAMPGSHPGSESYVQPYALWAWGPIVSLLESSSRRGNGLHKATSFVIESQAVLAGDYQRRTLIHLMHGAKGTHRYTFGAPYVGNDAYAPELSLTNAHMVNDMKDTSTLVAANDDILYYGDRGEATVALLHPWAGAMFDPDAFDGTQPLYFEATSDHMAAAFSIAQALAHASIPFDWIHEDDLTTDGLSGYDFLYVTSPNIKSSHQDAIANWSSISGHVLITTPSAGSFDEANTALATVSSLGGISETHTRQTFRSLVGSGAPVWTASPTSASVDVPLPGTISVIKDIYCADPDEYRSTISGGTVLATYDDNSEPAAILTDVGSGHRVHFGFFPGLALTYNGVLALNTDTSRLPVTWLAAPRDWVTWPLRNFGYVNNIETSIHSIEASMLTSEHGIAVPILNWWGEPKTFDMTLRPNAGVRAIYSNRHGNLAFSTSDDGAVTITNFTLVNVDILRISVEDKSSPPPTPYNLLAVPDTPTSIALTWNTPTYFNAPSTLKALTGK